MAVPQDIALSLEKKINNLKTVIENKSDGVLQIVEDILHLIKEHGIDSVPDVSIIPCVQLVLLLRWESNDVVANVANILAEVAKTAAGRERLATLQPPIAQQLVSLLQQKSADFTASGSLAVVTQVCRALGNMCYESDFVPERGQNCILDAAGLERLLMTLEKAVVLGNNVPQANILRFVIVGFLLNLTLSQHKKHKQVVSLGGLSLLCRVLELDGQSEDGSDTTKHAITILGYLLEHVAEGDVVLTNKVCQTLVQVLSTFSSSSVEICESVLELLRGHAEDDSVKRSLAQAGLCQLLIRLVEKHQPDVEDADEEAQHLFKMATDLIVLILNEDSSMTALYQNGKGEVYLSMLRWLKSDKLQLRTTGLLALGNLARCDTHCTKMVADGVHLELLNLLKQHNGQNEDSHLQHALLSALRHVAIPATNKAVIIDAGALPILLPMMNISVPTVIFKLLATFRMLIEGQERVAGELGKNKEFVHKLAEWSSSDRNTHVQAEATRLIAWILKNSKSTEVAATVVECNAIPPLVAMLSSEHSVMRNEALYSLNIVSTKQLSKAHPSLTEAKVGAKVASLLSQHGTSMEKATLCNVLELLGELVTSDNLVQQLTLSGVTESLTGLAAARNDISDLDELVRKLATALTTN